MSLSPRLWMFMATSCLWRRRLLAPWDRSLPCCLRRFCSLTAITISPAISESSSVAQSWPQYGNVTSQDANQAQTERPAISELKIIAARWPPGSRPTPATSVILKYHCVLVFCHLMWKINAYRFLLQAEHFAVIECFLCANSPPDCIWQS